jgi:hypothetical protein
MQEGAIEGLSCSQAIRHSKPWRKAAPTDKLWLPVNTPFDFMNIFPTLFVARAQ